MRRRLAAVGGAALLALVTLGAATGDPYRDSGDQWGLERIGAPQGWGTSRGEGVVVAVIDSGVDLDHPDLSGQLFRRDGQVVGRDYVDNDDDPRDEQGHGTLVAGIAAAAAGNGVGIAGVAPGARIMPIRVLDREGEGSSDDVDRAIRWAVDNGADIVNLSFEGSESDEGVGVDLPIPAPADAVEYAWSHGVVVVAAAGNSSDRSEDYPESSPVVLVGATDREDRPAEFSDEPRDDALMAPGVEIVSTWWCDPEKAEDPERCPHTYGLADGTSFAAPHVTGAAALLRATGLDHEQTVRRLRETARDLGEPGPDERTGHGLVDVAAALAPEEPTPSEPEGTQTPSGETSPAPSPEPPATPSSPEPTETTAETSPSPEPAGTPTDEPTGEPSPAGDPQRPADGTRTSPVPDPEPTRAPVAAEQTDDDGTAVRGLAVTLLALSLLAHAVARPLVR